MQELSQSNFRIRYRRGKEVIKSDRLTREAGDLPTSGDNRLTRNLENLLPKEGYWNSPDTLVIKLKVSESIELQDKAKPEILRASKVDNEFQVFKRHLDKGGKRQERNSAETISIGG